jgi:hypothetical protein
LLFNVMMSQRSSFYVGAEVQNLQHCLYKSQINKRD